MAQEAATLQLRALGHRYRGGPWVVRDVHASWDFGSLVAVTGANGAGKSTLLRLLAGVVRPRTGSVVGRPRSVGYVPERLAAPPIDVAHWLDALAALRGGTRRDTLARLEILGTVPPQRAPLASLSKGTLRKVLLADALAPTVPLLVLDEPWADLDAAGADALSGMLNERAGAGALVVVADHTGRAANVAAIEIALRAATSAPTASTPSTPSTATTVSFRGDPTRLDALDAAAEALGFRRVDP